MDLLIVTKDNVWDLEVHRGLPRTLEGNNLNIQRAMIASFIQTDSLPLMPTAGLPWTKYLLGEISLSEMDAQARANINLYMESLAFVPYYNIDKGLLTYSISRVEIAGAQL